MHVARDGVCVCVCVCVFVWGITILYQVSRLSLYGHTGVLGSGRSPLVQAFGRGEGCVPCAAPRPVRCALSARTSLP